VLRAHSTSDRVGARALTPGSSSTAISTAVPSLKASGRQLREELIRERSRSRQLEQLVHRLPAAERGGE